LFLLYCSISAQDFKVRGKIIDKLTGSGISYAVIMEINCTKATTSNSEGFFEIIPNTKNIILVCSCIGYASDTVSIDTGALKNSTNIYLTPYPELHKILFRKSKEYPASDLISIILAAKKTMFADIKNYEFIAHNKYISRENDGVGIGTGSIKVDESIFKESINLVSNIWENKPMRIIGINEFVSEGFYYSPSSYSEVIENHRSRFAIPTSINTLLGTRRIQNLYGNELTYYDRTFPGPLSTGELDYYKYYFEDTLMMDDRKIYRIYFEPSDNNDPGLTGYLYISGQSNRVVKIDAALNQSANDGNLFKNVFIIQQFVPYPNGIYLPVDYRIVAVSDYIGIIKTEYQLNSLLGEYIINSDTNSIDPKNSLLTVLPANSTLDSLSLEDQESVPLTQEEATAYTRIDSVRYLSKGFIYNMARIISPQYQLDNHYSISGPLNIYRFNHVEGHTLSFSGYGKDLFDNTTVIELTASHGFSDKRSKESFQTLYYPDDQRSLNLSVSAYNKITELFSSSDRYNSITSTIYSLFSNRDIRNFYYTNGFDFGINSELTSFLRINAVYSNHTDHSAQTNTTFSIFGSGRRNFNSNNNTFAFPDSVNSPIYDARLNTVSFNLNFDFRDNIQENNLRRKVSNGHSFFNFGAGILISSPKYLGSDIGFVSYNANIFTGINTYKTSTLSIEINGIYSNGPVPIQMQYALPGNISGTGRNFTFRTVGVGNIFGDQTLTINLEYNVRRELYRLIPLSIIQSLSLNTFFNSAWKTMSEKSAAIMPVAFTELPKPLLETGFNLGYSSLPLSLEFAWRLTHIVRNSFSVGINTSIL
jgi:hypothetical protein